MFSSNNIQISAIVDRKVNEVRHNKKPDYRHRIIICVINSQ